MARVFTADLIRSSGSKWGELRLDINPGTQSIPNNTTAITYELYIQRTATSFGGYWSNNTSTATLTINGTAISVSSFTYDFRTNYKKSLKTGSMTITHNADGTKTISASASVNMSGEVPNGSGSGSLALKTIPRASSFTMSGSTSTGTAFTVTISRASTSFTHRVRWRVGSGSWTNVSTNATTSASVNVPHSAFPSSTGGTVQVAVQTYNGSTAIGNEVYANRTLAVPAGIIPTVGSLTHSEYVTAVSSAIGEYVQNKSRITATMGNVTPGSGSTISSYRLTFNGHTINSSSGTFPVVTASGNLNLVATATDARGRTGQRTVTINVLAYAYPSILNYSVMRTTSSGTADLFNTYATVRFTSRVTSLNGKNTATYSIRSRQLPSGGWSTKTSTTAVGISQARSHTYSGYGITNEYQFEITISDKLHTTVLATDFLFLPSGGVNLAVGYGGVATGIGKIPTHGSTYNLEVGQKGMVVDGPIVGKEGQEVSYDSLFIPDTRNDNQPPSWYYENYPRRSVIEFKFANVVGLSNAHSTYVSLHTIVRWTGISGSGISQIAYGNNNELYFRTSGNNTSWLPWEQISTNKKGAVNWANSAGSATTISTVNYNNTSLQRVSFLSTQTITVSQNNATVIVQGSLVAQVTGQVVLARVKLGNTFSTTRAVTNRNVPHTLIINEVFTGVSKGNHTVELVWGTQSSSVTGTIPAYTSATILAWEL